MMQIHREAEMKVRCDQEFHNTNFDRVWIHSHNRGSTKQKNFFFAMNHPTQCHLFEERYTKVKLVFFSFLDEKTP